MPDATWSRAEKAQARVDKSDVFASAQVIHILSSHREACGFVFHEACGFVFREACGLVV